MLTQKMIKLIGMGMLRDKAGDGGDGSGGDKGDKGSGGSVTLSKEQFDAIMAKLPKEPEKKAEDDPTLADKARKEREDNEKKQGYEKTLESALNFNIAGKDFVKVNAGLLPKTIESLFTQAEKEIYGSAIEKANAIKVGVVSEFFAVQANHDLLTGSQKIQLDEFLKLTKNGKQDRIENIYSMIFEPTLETLRKVEKAKQVNSGGKDQSDSEKMQVERMIKMSKKHYLGEKDA